MRAESPVLPVFRAMFAGAWQEESLPSAPFIELPRTWADFLAEHSANYRQRLGRFHRKHQTRLLIAGEQITVAEALKVIRDLNLGRWAGQGSSFKSERYERFHALIAKRLEAKQRLLLVLLEADGVIVAGRYDFVYAGKGWNFQGGWRPDWEKQSVGKMVLAEVVRLCIERGLREYDLLAGKSGYKDELATGGHEILRAQAWRPGSWKGRCWQELRALRFRVSSK